ncbi:proline-rich transmembrane protein 3 isoform X2 [Ambystoma mexicanum]|uniref:proline-rich transmembrane protein 3 isoform X2 n=1 Tax=Ambystoma mexicanum TaxID=8296 RepID=UPI0037E73B67
MMARPAPLHVWTFLVALVLTESSLQGYNADNVIGSKDPNPLTIETPPRNVSQALSQNQNGDLRKSNSANPVSVNTLDLETVGKHNGVASTLTEAIPESLPLREVTPPPSNQNEEPILTPQDSPLDIPPQAEATGGAPPRTTLSQKPVTNGSAKQSTISKTSSGIQNNWGSLTETVVASAAHDQNPLDINSNRKHVSDTDIQDLKEKSLTINNGATILKTLAMPSEENNDFEIAAFMDNGVETRMSSARPTVSTISLVTSPQIIISEVSKTLATDIDRNRSLKPKVLLQSTGQDTGVGLAEISLKVDDVLADHDSNALSPPQANILDHSVTIGAHQMENNDIDEKFVTWNLQESQPLVSEKYLASYRTTQSYSSVEDRHLVPTTPGSNEVLSVYVENVVEPMQENLDITRKNGKDPQTSWKGKGNEATANSETVYYPELTPESGVSMASKQPVIPRDSPRVDTYTKTPKQDQTTWLTSFTKEILPDSLSSYPNGDIALETRVKTWTEKLFAHQLSTRRPISSPAQGVDSSKDGSSEPTAIMKESGRRAATSLLFPSRIPIAPTPDMHVVVVQAYETATPHALALSKDPADETANTIPRLGIGTVSPQTSSSPTAISKIPITVRRGQIRVTTQRALQRPRLVDASPNVSAMFPSLAPPCMGGRGACELLVSNRTLLQWNDLKRTLSFAWELHVYGTAVLYLVLSIIALINLIGSPILHIFNLPYIMASNALLVLVGILRAVFFFTDPYATKSMLSPQMALVLYNITFPLILTTFAVLVLLMLNMAELQMLPPKIQSLPLLAVVGVVHFIVLFSSDLFSHFLNPSVNVVLHILSASWGTFLMVGNAVAYHQLRTSSDDIVSRAQMESPDSDDNLDMQVRGRNLKCLFTTSRVLLACSVFGLLCCGCQVYAVLWLFQVFGRVHEFSWSWWFLQFWYRIFELALCFAMLLVASHPFCQKCGSNDHTCWAKIVQFLCTYRKTEVPEYPNNCYDWANSHQDKLTNNDISKNLIRNPPESVPLRALKDNNENKVLVGFYKNGSSSPLAKPKPGLVFGPKTQNLAMGRSHTSICFEKDSMLSLADLEFRPPSPINLSRSIDEALFKEHLVRDSIFLDSSLQYPSYLSRQDSCSSLKECSALNQTIDPLISSDLKLRRNSIPDYMYSLARCSSVTDVNSPSVSLPQSKDLPNDLTTEGAASGSSLDSFSKGSIKISWNPWRHGLSSVESLPLEDAPSTHLLAQEGNKPAPAEAKEPKKDSAKSLIKIGQPTDCHSISSDTIEL